MTTPTPTTPATRFYAKGKESAEREWNAIDCRNWLESECATLEKKQAFMAGRRDAQARLG